LERYEPNPGNDSVSEATLCSCNRAQQMFWRGVGEANDGRIWLAGIVGADGPSSDGTRAKRVRTGCPQAYLPQRED
jgi:hypothetical protein